MRGEALGIQPVRMPQYGRIGQTGLALRSGNNVLEQFRELRLVGLVTHALGQPPLHGAPQHPLPYRSALALVLRNAKAELRQPTIKEGKPKFHSLTGRIAVVPFKDLRLKASG